MNPFPIPDVNGTIAVTSSTQAIALQGAGGSVLLQNVGTTECFVKVGASTVTAVAGGSSTDETDGSLSIPGGAIVVYSIPQTASHIAAICAGVGTTTLRVSRGSGG